MGWVVVERQIAGRDLRVLLHNGDTGDFHADVILIPDDGWGLVLLTNANNTLQQERIANIATGAAFQLIGLPPPPPPFPALRTVFIGVALLVVFELAGIARSAMLVRRWRAEPARRPSGLVPIVVRVLLPPAALLAVAWLPVAILPSMFDAPFSLLRHYDVGVLLIASGALALVWSALRATLIAVALQSDRPDAPALPREREPVAHA